MICQQVRTKWFRKESVIFSRKKQASVYQKHEKSDNERFCNSWNAKKSYEYLQSNSLNEQEAQPPYVKTAEKKAENTYKDKQDKIALAEGMHAWQKKIKEGEGNYI